MTKGKGRPSLPGARCRRAAEEKDSAKQLPALPGSLGQYATGFTAWFLEPPGCARTMPAQASCPEASDHPAGQPTAAAGDPGCQNHH